jgi:hypothetical protein
VKSFSNRGASRNDAISLIIGRPGPCWISRSTGLEASAPRTRIHCIGVAELYCVERVDPSFSSPNVDLA